MIIVKSCNIFHSLRREYAGAGGRCQRQRLAVAPEIQRCSKGIRSRGLKSGTHLRIVKSRLVQVGAKCSPGPPLGAGDTGPTSLQRSTETSEQSTTRAASWRQRRARGREDRFRRLRLAEQCRARLGICHSAPFRGCSRVGREHYSPRDIPGQDPTAGGGAPWHGCLARFEALHRCAQDGY